MSRCIIEITGWMGRYHPISYLPTYLHSSKAQVLTCSKVAIKLRVLTHFTMFAAVESESGVEEHLTDIKMADSDD